jgi:hypothetical protein
MSRALKSAFFRFFRTKWFAKVVIFSVLMGLFVIMNTCTQVYGFMFFKRPRYLDQEFLISAWIQVYVVMPFAIAIFCSSFTGNDLAFRSINNKVATGISRRCIYLADLVVSVTASVLGSGIACGLILAYAKFWPTRAGVKINAYTVRFLLCVLVTSIAFTALYTLLQYFFSSKLFALIIALLLIPCFIVLGQYVDMTLSEPYRYSYTNEETGEVTWELNPGYVGGTSRKVLTFVYETMPFNFEYIVYPESADFNNNLTAGAIVIVLTSAAGVSVMKKRELS